MSRLGGSMEFKMFNRIISCTVILIVQHAACGRTEIKSGPDSVTITGTILDSITGNFPQNDSVFAIIDSGKVVPDTEGAFSTKVPKKEFHTISVLSRHFEKISMVVKENSEKMNYFITCILRKLPQAPNEVAINQAENKIDAGPCWTVSGCIVDSKHDLAIKSDSFTVAFDDSLIEVTKKGSFQVYTCDGGNHVFHIEVPGYNEVIEQVDLKKDEKQPFIIIPTTMLGNKISRREITVTAKREPGACDRGRLENGSHTNRNNQDGLNAE